MITRTSWHEGLAPDELLVRGLQHGGPWLLLALVAGVVLRALLRQRRYRVERVFDDAARADVHAALRAVEERTSGEIVPVVLERSDAHAAARWLAALVALLLGSVLLEARLPWGSPGLLLAAQAGLGAAGWLLAFLLPGVQRLFLSEVRASEAAQEQAFKEFHALGLHRTAGGTGVLLLVSLLEQRVVVLADDGIAGRVDDGVWTNATQAVLAGIRRGSLKDGVCAGLRLCGEVLAEHAPARPGDRNEVPDRLVVRRR